MSILVEFSLNFPRQLLDQTYNLIPLRESKFIPLDLKDFLLSIFTLPNTKLRAEASSGTPVLYNKKIQPI